MNSDRGGEEAALFERGFPVLFHELDYNGTLGPVTLLNLMQTTASMHTLELGISASHLKQQGLTWVISRIHLVVERYPRAREVVHLRTWPSLREGIFTCREFQLFDGAGQPLGRASSSWAVINVETRRPVRLEGNLRHYPRLERRAVEDDFSPLPQFPGPSEPELSFRVRRSDLDLNHHVNNTVFAAWALEGVPDEVASASLTELEISFRAEVLYGEKVLSRCAVQERGDSPCCLHQIVNRRDGRELARLRTRWRR